jgi:hypothetical protein
VVQQVAGEHRVGGELVEQGVVGALGELVRVGREGHRTAGRADSVKALGEGAQRLGLEHGGPRRHEVRREVRVGGLERVVPVAVAVCRQRAPGDRALRDARDRTPEVLGDRRGLAERVVADEGDRLVEQARVARRAQVVANRKDRPEDDVAVRVLLPGLRERRQELEGLRPVAAGVLRPEDAQQHVAHRVLTAERGEQADRSLAHVARAPGATGELLQAARREVVDEGVVGEPRQRRGEVVGRVATCTERRAVEAHRVTGLVPERRSEALTRRGDLSGGRLPGAGGGGDEDLDLLARVEEDGEPARSAADAVGLEPGVADLGAARSGPRDAPRAGVAHRRDVDVVSGRRHGRRFGEVVGDLHREQHPTRCPATLPDRQRQGVLVGRGARGHGEHGTRGAGIPPRAVVETREPRARALEEAPRAVGVLDEEPHAVGALEAEVGAASRRDGVAADVPAGDLRVEGAGHPHGRGERAGVGGERVAGAEQVAVRAQDRQLLGGRHELAAADRPGALGAVAVGLDVGPAVDEVGVLELGAVERSGGEGRG